MSIQAKARATLARVKAMCASAQEREVARMLSVATPAFWRIALPSRLANMIAASRQRARFQAVIRKLSEKLIALERRAAVAHFRDAWREFEGALAAKNIAPMTRTKAMEIEVKRCVSGAATIEERYANRAQTLDNSIRRALAQSHDMPDTDAARLRHLNQTTRDAFTRFSEACQQDFSDVLVEAGNLARVWALAGMGG